MRCYYDTEFLEGTQDKKFLVFTYGKTNPTIDLISIGIVAEDGREFYAVSKDFNLYEAWNRCEIKQEWYSIDESMQSTREVKVYWIRENVLKPIFEDLSYIDYPCSPVTKFTYESLKYLIDKYGKSNKQIAFEVLNFIHGHADIGDWCGTLGEYYNMLSRIEPKDKPEFYGYYSAYDHVALCWLFGKMIDLPKGFPMYTIDLKQELDNFAEMGKIIVRSKSDGFSERRHFIGDLYNTQKSDMLDYIKDHRHYPKQTNEHHALADARWNKQLHEFLLNL